MPRIFQRQDNGLMTELPHDFDYTDRLHSRELMIEAIVLASDAEVREFEIKKARQERDEARAALARSEAESKLVRDREAGLAKLKSLGLNDDEIKAIIGR